MDVLEGAVNRVVGKLLLQGRLAGANHLKQDLAEIAFSIDGAHQLGLVFPVHVCVG